MRTFRRAHPGWFELAVLALAYVELLRRARLDAWRRHPGGRERGRRPPARAPPRPRLPSFQAGWNLLLGIELFRLSRNVLVRAFAIAAPLTMAFAVVATANHFVLDVVGGAIAVILPLVALSRLDQYSARAGFRSPRDARHSTHHPMTA